MSRTRKHRFSLFFRGLKSQHLKRSVYVNGCKLKREKRVVLRWTNRKCRNSREMSENMRFLEQTLNMQLNPAFPTRLPARKAPWCHQRDWVRLWWGLGLPGFYLWQPAFRIRHSNAGHCQVSFSAAWRRHAILRSCAFGKALLQYAQRIWSP